MILTEAHPGIEKSAVVPVTGTTVAAGAIVVETEVREVVVVTGVTVARETVAATVATGVTEVREVVAATVATGVTVARETVAATVVRETVVVTAAREAVAVTVVIAAAEVRGIEIVAPGMIAENGEIPTMTVVAHGPTGTMRAVGKIAVNAVHGGLPVVMMGADGGQVRRADASSRPFRRRLVTKTTR